MLGMGQEQAGKAVSAAVPTLLAGLAEAASKPGGGAKLANVLAKQDQGVLDNLSGLFSGGGGAATAQGSNMLSSLLGGGGLGQISSVLSRFTGVSEDAIGKLLGLLAPIVMSAIGKQAKGLDAAGIANMLAGQRGTSRPLSRRDSAACFPLPSPASAVSLATRRTPQPRLPERPQMWRAVPRGRPRPQVRRS